MDINLEIKNLLEKKEEVGLNHKEQQKLKSLLDMWEGKK